MKTWHYRRIRFEKADPPRQAADGSWVFFFVCVKNSNPLSPIRETHWACETLGL